MNCESSYMISMKYLLGLSSSKSFLEFSDSFDDRCIGVGLNFICGGTLCNRSE